MNRRGFLGLLGATPFAAKKAAAEAVSSLVGISGPMAIPSGGDVPASLGSLSSSRGGPDDVEWATKQLSRFLNPKNLERMRKNIVVTRLDPDLASMQSMSLSARMAIQKERRLQETIDSERSWLERMIEGEED